MTDEEAMLQLIEHGCVYHVLTREEQDLGIATFTFNMRVTNDVTDAMAKARQRAKENARLAIEYLKGLSDE